MIEVARLTELMCGLNEAREASTLRQQAEAMMQECVRTFCSVEVAMLSAT